MPVIPTGLVSVGDIETLLDRSAAPGMSASLANPKSSDRAVGADLDVRRLQIPMNDALLVRRLERLRKLCRNGQRLGQRDRALREPLREIVAIHELHRQRGQTSAVLEPVNCRDVRMVQRREHLRFALETRNPFGIAGEDLRQDLDRDVAAKLGIARTIHLAHAAGADGRQDLIRTDASTGLDAEDYHRTSGYSRAYNPRTFEGSWA
jgi:hypothetical protein